MSFATLKSKIEALIEKSEQGERDHETVAALIKRSANYNLVVPDDVTTIGYQAFFLWTGLKSIEMHDKITRINNGAFQECSRITSIVMPNSVTHLGHNAFQNCTSLKSITLSNALPALLEKPFHGCTALESITIPNSVTSIGKEAFYNCTSLTSVLMLGELTSITSNAFSQCNALTDIYVPWAEGAVANAPWGATNATIHYNYGLNFELNTDGSSYTVTGSNDALSKVYIPDTYNGLPVTAVADYAFDGMHGNAYKLKEITLGNNIDIIGEIAFYCTAVEHLIIKPPISSIGDYGFGFNQQLKSVRFERWLNIDSISNSAFADCPLLTDIYVPWYDGYVLGAPWGATNATIHYEATED